MWKLHHLGSQLFYGKHSPFSWRVVCVWSSVILSFCFLPIEFWELNNLLSFPLLTVPFNISWQCFCWYKSLKYLVHLPCISHEFTLLGKSSSTDLSWIISYLFLVSDDMSNGIYMSHIYFSQNLLGDWILRSFNLSEA